MRDTTKLHPDLQIKLEKLKSECKKQGLIIGISETLRTVAEQDKLYAQGRTKPGAKVTNAKGSTYSSMHQWGVAFDFFRNDGKGAYVDNDGFFTKVGKIGKSIGLEWGGDWRNPVDKPHFQLPDWGSTPTKLKSKYKTPEAFMKTWKVNQIPATVENYVKDGIDYSRVFEPRYYSEHNPDVPKGGFKTNKQLFEHFLKYGMKERRQAIATFNINAYAGNYADLRNAFGSNWPEYYKHYCKVGYMDHKKCV